MTEIMKKNLSTKFILFGIILLAAFFRFYNLNWDQGFHLHPDERAIVLAVVKLAPPHSLSQFLSPDSPWNPHFFAYGSFPFYLLWLAGLAMSLINPLFSQYDQINLVGRAISAFSDLLTILVIFRMGRKLFSKNIGLLAAFFYSVSVLPIQLSHFYAVDTLLTLFIIITIYQLMLFYEKPTIWRSLLIGLFFGLALATKISAFVLIASIAVTLVVDFALLFFRAPHMPRQWLPHLPVLTKHLITYAVLIGVATGITYTIAEPYALIDFKELQAQTIQQSQMTSNAFTFPYTLQYVGKIPYLYEAKNIFFYGLGPLLGTLAFIGAANFTFIAFAKAKTGRRAKELILLSFFAAYVFVVGKFAIGFMRYMLPVYPLLSLFAAFAAFWLFTFLKKNIKNQLIYYFSLFIFQFSFLIWPLSFLHIYTQKNTRSLATDWINTSIPAGKTLAIEHWDDSLPLTGQEKYHMLTLTLYDPDTPEKWMNTDRELKQTDFVIIASNRLYVPLQKLTDCQHLPPDRCYRTTAVYYRHLFTGQNVLMDDASGQEVRFEKVAEFSDNPTIPFLGIPINDQGADESFTVYDHPKVMIFKKIEPL